MTRHVPAYSQDERAVVQHLCRVKKLVAKMLTRLVVIILMPPASPVPTIVLPAYIIYNNLWMVLSMVSTNIGGF